MSDDPPPLLTLHHWVSVRGITGDRFTLQYEGKSVITRGTELECRIVARQMGWVVRRESELAESPGPRPPLSAP